MTEYPDARTRRPRHRRRAAPGCARPSRPRPPGVSVGLVCKSLLGKAHTVMAEGGIAAALANVDDRDNWQVHFADTMRGGQYLNNWRMAELHAKEAPDRVRELEAWGAVFDRTTDGRILQRNFGGHRYPRLAHVGDRTGLEMIRTLQDHGIHQGIDVHMECTVVDAAQGRRPRRRARSATTASAAASASSRRKAVVLATGGIGRAYKITSNSWEYTGDGHALAYDAGRGADGHGVRPVPSRPGMVWPPSVRGILVTEGVRGEGGVLLNKRGPSASCSTTSRRTTSAQTADNEEEGWRYTQGDKNARRPPELLTRDHVARCIMREVQGGPRQPARRRVPRHRLDQGEASRTPPSTSRRSCRACTTSSSSSPTSTSRRSRWRSGPTTHYIMGGVRVDGDTQMSTVPGLFAAGECAAGLHGANRLGGNSLSDLLVFGKRAGRVRGASSRKEHAAGRDRRRRRSDARPRAALAPFERGGGGEGPYQIQHDLQEMMQDLVGIVRIEDEMQQALEGIDGLQRARARRSASPGNREYNPGWHTALDLHNLLTVSEAITRCGARAQGEPRRPLPRRLSRTRTPASARSTSSCARAPDGAMQLAPRADPRDAAPSCKQIIEEMK